MRISEELSFGSGQDIDFLKPWNQKHVEPTIKMNEFKSVLYFFLKEGSKKNNKSQV